MNIRCPTCRNPVKSLTQRWRPFCSERCQMIDFGKWSSEEHCIPGEEQKIPSEEENNTYSF